MIKAKINWLKSPQLLFFFGKKYFQTIYPNSKVKLHLRLNSLGFIVESFLDTNKNMYRTDNKRKRRRKRRRNKSLNIFFLHFLSITRLMNSLTRIDGRLIT